MRDFRDAKAMAQTIRAALAAKGVKISIGESLELVAKALGAADWNTLVGRDPGRPPLAETPLRLRPPPTEPSDSGATSASHDGNGAAPSATFCQLPALEATCTGLWRCAQREAQPTRPLEHLLLALTDDADASAVLDACLVDRALLGRRSRATSTTSCRRWSPRRRRLPPTAGFHRVVQRAVIHVQVQRPRPVTGANLLVAIFSERESHACYFLIEHRA